MSEGFAIGLPSKSTSEILRSFKYLWKNPHRVQKRISKLLRIYCHPKRRWIWRELGWQASCKPKGLSWTFYSLIVGHSCCSDCFSKQASVGNWDQSHRDIFGLRIDVDEAQGPFVLATAIFWRSFQRPPLVSFTATDIHRDQLPSKHPQTHEQCQSQNLSRQTFQTAAACCRPGMARHWSTNRQVYDSSWHRKWRTMNPFNDNLLIRDFYINKRQHGEENRVPAPQAFLKSWKPRAILWNVYQSWSANLAEGISLPSCGRTEVVDVNLYKEFADIEASRRGKLSRDRSSILDAS